MATPSIRMKPAGHASPEQVAMAVAALSEADLVRLAGAARLRARGLVGMDWQDLLHEAVQRALDGTRRWPVEVPFAAFLRGIMRSLASEARRVEARTRSTDEPGGETLADAPSSAVDPEAAAMERDVMAALDRLFAEDPIALGIFSGIAEGLSPGEMQARLGIGQTDYDSARRRIRRRIAASSEMFA